MPVTYQAIATNTLSSPASSVTFTGISGAYTDLVAITNFTSDTNASILGYRLNSDTGTNYSRLFMWGNGSAGDAGQNANQTYAAIGYWQTGTGNQILSVTHLFNYSNTTMNKTSLTRWNQINGIDNSATTSTAVWRSLSAVTSITFLNTAGNFTAGSTFTLYGIKEA